MKIASVICEYNPFHNGHKYQIEKIKQTHDALICVMSGAFVQRGEPAIFDKWSRTKAALLNGSDLVVELPVCYALNTAERFAFGGVELIDKMNVVDTLFFGSECGDIDLLYNAAKIMLKEDQNTTENIKKYLSDGISYPKAISLAYDDKIENSIISKPNNILAIEYLKALISINSNINPATIKRYKSDYNDPEPTSEFSSATAIRNLIKNKDEISAYVPKNTLDLYNALTPGEIDELSGVIQYILKTKTAYELSQINDMTEGLENRIKELSNEFFNICELAENIKTKRYTQTKINRILMSIILNITKDIAKDKNEYLRVLGMNKTGMKLLSEIKEHSSLQIITKPSDFKDFNRSYSLDIFSGDIYSVCCKNSKYRDYYNSPVIIK